MKNVKISFSSVANCTFGLLISPRVRRHDVVQASEPTLHGKKQTFSGCFRRRARKNSQQPVRSVLTCLLFLSIEGREQSQKTGMGTENHFQLRTGSKSSDSLEMRFPPRFFFYQHRQVFLTDVKLVRHCRELSTRRSHGGGEESVHFKKKYSETITEKMYQQSDQYVESVMALVNQKDLISFHLQFKENQVVSIKSRCCQMQHT